MTPEQAADLAARINAAIDGMPKRGGSGPDEIRDDLALLNLTAMNRLSALTGCAIGCYAVLYWYRRNTRAH